MAETENIARLAEIVSNDLFARFFWGRTGSWNQNWACENEAHKPRKTHPSDVVFYYDEPYALSRIYLNCDLKSYASRTINAGVIQSALEDLAQTLTCMETSETWQQMYVHEGSSPFMCGLLFIYNHDGDYDRNFDHLLTSVKYDEIQIPRGSQIIVLGPQQIRWLDNVRYEMVYMRGNGELPGEQFCRFEYPHLVRKKKVQIEKAKAATVDMLTGPWVTLGYDAVNDQPPGILIFYRGKGASAEEFLYLIDYLMHYQMVKPGLRLRVRTLDPDANAAAHFERAIVECTEKYQGGTEIADLLRNIEYKQIAHVHRSFSQIEVGMEHG